jgi:LsmAD domain
VSILNESGEVNVVLCIPEEKDSHKSSLTFQKLSPRDESSSYYQLENEKSTSSLSSLVKVSIHAVKDDFGATRSSSEGKDGKNGLRIDGEIASSHSMLIGRELQTADHLLRMTPGDANLTLDELEAENTFENNRKNPRSPSSMNSRSSSNLTPNGSKWDQFQVNKAKFGVESTYSEDYYTSKLDHKMFSSEQIARANKLAKEIDSGSSYSNLDGEGLDAKEDMTEEERWSSVLPRSRGGFGSPSSSPSNAQGGLGASPRKYVPPHARAAATAEGSVSGSGSGGTGKQSVEPPIKVETETAVASSTAPAPAPAPAPASAPTTTTTPSTPAFKSKLNPSASEWKPKSSSSVVPVESSMVATQGVSPMMFPQQHQPLIPVTSPGQFMGYPPQQVPMMMNLVPIQGFPYNSQVPMQVMAPWMQQQQYTGNPSMGYTMQPQ